MDLLTYDKPHNDFAGRPYGFPSLQQNTV